MKIAITSKNLKKVGEVQACVSKYCTSKTGQAAKEAR